LTFPHSLASRVGQFREVNCNHDEEHDDVADSHREGWHEQVIDLILEGNAEEPEEQEVRRCTHEEEEGTQPVVGVMFECKYGVCHEDANTIG
jgi:hypothetical protein